MKVYVGKQDLIEPAVIITVITAPPYHMCRERSHSTYSGEAAS